MFFTPVLFRPIDIAPFNGVLSGPTIVPVSEGGGAAVIVYVTDAMSELVKPANMPIAFTVCVVDAVPNEHMGEPEVGVLPSIVQRVTAPIVLSEIL